MPDKPGESGSPDPAETPDHVEKPLEEGEEQPEAKKAAPQQPSRPATFVDRHYKSRKAPIELQLRLRNLIEAAGKRIAIATDPGVKRKRGKLIRSVSKKHKDQALGEALGQLGAMAMVIVEGISKMQIEDKELLNDFKSRFEHIITKVEQSLRSDTKDQFRTHGINIGMNTERFETLASRVGQLEHRYWGLVAALSEQGIFPSASEFRGAILPKMAREKLGTRIGATPMMGISLIGETRFSVYPAEVE